MQKLEHHEYIKCLMAYKRFRAIMNLPSNQNSRRQFKIFLTGSEDGLNISLTEEAENRLDWMCGDNWQTLFKAWQAQNE